MVTYRRGEVTVHEKLIMSKRGSHGIRGQDSAPVTRIVGPLLPNKAATAYEARASKDRGPLPPSDGGSGPRCPRSARQPAEKPAWTGAGTPMSERQAGFQQGQALVDTGERVLEGGLLGPAFPRQRYRHDHADDRAGDGPDRQVVRGPPGPAGHGLGHHRDAPGELVHGPGPDLGHR